MSDLYYSSVSLLLHCDGNDNSTTFTDNSPSPKTVTANGGAKLNATIKKFGSASGYFDGSGDYLSLGATHLDSNDFTVEMWVRLASNTGNKSLVSQYNGAQNARTILDIRSGKLSIFNGSNGLQSGSTTIAIDAWYHVAFVRSGTTCKGYLNGALEVTHSNFQTPYATTTLLGSYPGSTSDDFSGYIDDIRITNGVARYTSSFTPPTEAFPNYGPVVTLNGIASATALGSPSIHRYIAPTGYAGTPAFGTPFFTDPKVDLVGFAGTPVFGTFTLFESLAYLHLNGFAGTPAFGALRLQEFLLPSGFADATLFGNPKLVPQIRLNAFNGTALFGTPDFAPPPIAKNWLRTRYQCTLTGAADGETDLLLPMSSFAIRLNPSTASSFVQVVVPGVDSYADAIAARPNGSILITRIYDYLDNSSLTYEMARADFDNMRTDTGGQSGSTGTLQGYYTLTSSGARTYDLSDPTYRSWDGETVRYRCALDPRIRPGDTVTINEETLELRSIQHNVDVTLCLSEISGVLV